MTNDGDPMDDHSHGSHVAGTIGAVASNNLGVVGINWHCSIVGLKFLGAGGSGSVSDAIEAMEYVIDNGIRVSNNSWGGGGFSQALYDLIQASQAVGHIFVAAAGNSYANSDVLPMYPAAYDLPNIISVAATDNDDNKASFSNFGPNSVDLGAPGVTILSTVLDSGYAYFKGTSMAAPHVTGVVALVMSRHPIWSWQQVRERVFSSVRPVDSLLGITVTGGVVTALNVGDCNENGVPDEDDIAGGIRMYGGFAAGQTRLDERDPEVNESVLSGDLLGDDNPPRGFGSGPCCDALSAMSCDDTTCAEAVCADMAPFTTCCDGGWSLSCVIRALDVCCDLCGNRCDNSHHVVTTDGTDEATLLDGFTITGGRAINLGAAGKGGGLVNRRGNVTIRNCRITGNSGRTAAAGMFNWKGAANIENSAFVNNRAPIGGAVTFYVGQPRVTNCLFVGNAAAIGGAVDVSDGGSFPIVTGSVFNGNRAGTGGAVSVYFDTNPSLINCTITANTATEAGAGLFVQSGTPVITNTIVWGNTAAGAMDENAQLGGQDPAISFSCVQGWTGSLGGVSNGGADPQFTDPAGADGVVGIEDDDLSLTTASPYLDAGNNVAVPLGVTTDFAGRPRFLDYYDVPDTGNGVAPIVDLGVHERWGGFDCNDNGNGIPDQCEPDSLFAAPYPHDRRKNRYISFDPNKTANDGIYTAFRVELKQIILGSCDGPAGGPVDFCREDRGSADCKACSGSGKACISASIDCSPGESCNPTGAVCVNNLPNSGGSNVGRVWWIGPAKNTASDPSLNIHLLVSEPFRKVDADWPIPVHVGDCEIVPRAVYGVRAVEVSTGAESDELVVETTRFPPATPPAPFWWGDAVGVLAFHCNADIREQTCDPDTSDADCTGPGTPAPCCTGMATGPCDCPGGEACARAWELPNGVTNIDDVTAALWTSAPAPPTARMNPTGRRLDSGRFQAGGPCPLDMGAPMIRARPSRR